MHNGLAQKEDFPFITYYCPHCHALNKPKNLHLDERISCLASPNTVSPKTGDGGAVKSASPSAVESIIPSNSPVSAGPEIEEISEKESFEEKAN
uniref:Lunapark zinc ribbon domain-containing protein n=1 Tax=Lotus japonicus TaxID=34305 RepID=I3T554_LOTJA|nr:unknown [Lotus japonicus]